MTILQLVERLIDAVQGCKLDKRFMKSAAAERKELAKRLNLTETQAVFLAMFVNMADDSKIAVGDLARFLSCKPVRVQTYWPDLEELARRRFIIINAKSGDRVQFKVSAKAMSAFRKDIPYEPEAKEHLTLGAWIDQVEELFYDCELGAIDFNLLIAELTLLQDGNPDLPIAKHLQKYSLGDESTVILLRAVLSLVQDNDDSITSNDIFSVMNNPFRARMNTRNLSADQHELILKGLLEYKNEDGRVNTDAWSLTDKAKRELLDGMHYGNSQMKANDLIHADKLPLKQLYFNSEVTDAVDRLRSLLQQEQFAQVQQRLQEHGMRKGFACLFYGAPGTGKTETVYQLARATGRDIMIVDVPNMRSKWVGETEKNIKALFDRYRSLVERCEVAPILLFNEADAVLGRRNENSANSVDKMENAMQNIILQEMENMTGIMIATTNLTSNLDDAFERRFLYKIEFPKPSPQESRHIWKSLLPEISDDDALLLAKQYAFSGGQIENIARKQVVNAILFPSPDGLMEQIRQSCDSERLNKNKTRPIGFY